jgi:hypothetical protein
MTLALAIIVGVFGLVAAAIGLWPYRSLED